jgi:heme A synthase
MKVTPMRNADTAAPPPAEAMSSLLQQYPFAVYAWGVVVYNLAAILWGALVRVTGSGAGCGDHWPLCNGTVTLVSPDTHTLIEFTHRVMSGLDLALVAGLILWGFRRFPRGHGVRLGAIFSGVFLVTEALLGAGLVLLKLVARDATAWSQSLHLLNTLALVAALTLTAWWASGYRAVRPRGRAATLGLIGLGAFALLGVSGVIAALGDTLFPALSLSQGLAQDFDPGSSMFLRLRIWHPAIAIAVALWLLYYALWSAREGGVVRRLAYAMVGIMVLQMAAGALNLLLLAPVWLQLLHLLVADLLWISMVLLVSESGSRGPAILPSQS